MEPVFKKISRTLTKPIAVLLSKTPSATSSKFLIPKFACFAHRGGWVDPRDSRRENTQYAFQKAIDLGYRYLETDCQISLDNTLIAFHDENIDQITDGSGLVADLTLAELREVKIAGIDPIMTMDEMLDTFKEAFINIDIKNPTACIGLAELIRRHNAKDRVCVASFNTEALKYFRKITSNQITTAASPASVTKAVLSSKTPQLAGRQLPKVAGDVFQVPTRSPYPRLNLRIVTKNFVDYAHANGQKVHVWTINDPQEMYELIDLGVDGIISDDISALKQVAVDTGVWE